MFIVCYMHLLLIILIIIIILCFKVDVYYESHSLCESLFCVVLGRHENLVFVGLFSDGNEIVRSVWCEPTTMLYLHHHHQTSVTLWEPAPTDKQSFSVLVKPRAAFSRSHQTSRNLSSRRSAPPLQQEYSSPPAGNPTGTSASHWAAAWEPVLSHQDYLFFSPDHRLRVWLIHRLILTGGTTWSGSHAESLQPRFPSCTGPRNLV